MTTIPFLKAEELTQKYDALFIDAFGVLVTTSGAIDGAPRFIQCLNSKGFPYYIVTNASSAHPKHLSIKYSKMGFDIPEDKIISSGNLIPDWLLNAGIEDNKAYVLGPKSSFFMAEHGKFTVVASDSNDFSVFIIGNQTGFPFVEQVDHSISAIFRQLDKGKKIELLLPNPDLIYPSSKDGFGITSGMIAEIIEKSLEIRYGRDAPKFTKFGKPFLPIFEKAKQFSGACNPAMIGDQIQTDIIGANRAGIDSILIGTGLSNLDHLPRFYEELEKPKFLLRDFI